MSTHDKTVKFATDKPIVSRLNRCITYTIHADTYCLVIYYSQEKNELDVSIYYDSDTAHPIINKLQRLTVGKHTNIVSDRIELNTLEQDVTYNTITKKNHHGSANSNTCCVNTRFGGFLVDTYDVTRVGFSKGNYFEFTDVDACLIEGLTNKNVTTLHAQFGNDYPPIYTKL